MIDLKGTMGIAFLKKSRFTGSDGRLRYVLEKRGAAAVPEGALWPGRTPENGAAAVGPEAGVQENRAAAAVGPEAGTPENSAAAVGPEAGAQENRAAAAVSKSGGAVPPEGDCLAVVYWYGPYCSDATPEEEKQTAYFPFSDEGLALAQAWLNGIS